MRIAFFLAEFPVLSETFVIRQVSGMVDAGHEVHILVGKCGDLNLENERYRSSGLAKLVHPLRAGDRGGLSRVACVLRFGSAAMFSARGRRALAAGLQAAFTGCAGALLDIAVNFPRGSVGNFDAVIAHFGPVGVRAMYLQKAGMMGGPIATVFHGFDMSDTATVARNIDNYRRLFRSTAMLLPISDLWRARLQADGAPASKTRVLHMGVDLDRLPMRVPGRPLGRPLRVLSVARFTEKKGLEYAIRGVAQARAQIEYTVIGSGALESRLHELAAQAPAGTIKFLGKQPQHRVFEALDAADVFLLPSVTAAGGDMEGVPVVLMEAMAKGVLVVATRHSAIPELVEDGVSGLLVAERDAEGIALALDRIADGEVDVAPMRVHARQVVETRFNNRHLDGEIEDVCRLLCAGGNAEPDQVLRAA